MEIQDLLNDKLLKPAQKTEVLSKLLLSGEIGPEELISIAAVSKDPAKAGCVESIEWATRTRPEIGTSACLEFVTGCLSSKSPRLKWESARVIGNICHLFPDQLDGAVRNLLENSENPGTVVRWSAAYALGQILKLKTVHNPELIPAVEAIIEREEKNSIRKIYLAALGKCR